MKYALIKNGAVDTISYVPVLQHVQAEDGYWSFLYEMHDITAPELVKERSTDPETGEAVVIYVERPVTRTVPKRDEAGEPIGILDPAWVEVPDDVFGGYLQQGSTFVAPPSQPLPPPSMSPLEFIDRLTDAEQLNLATAAMSQPRIKLWYDKLLAADTINLGDVRLASGVQAMVAAGLLTSARAAELLGH